jgi:hypothetical protein
MDEATIIFHRGGVRRLLADFRAKTVSSGQAADLPRNVRVWIKYATTGGYGMAGWVRDSG